MGPQGPAGADGVRGATGPQGADGARGATGPQGSIGPKVYDANDQFIGYIVDSTLGPFTNQNSQIIAYVPSVQALFAISLYDGSYAGQGLPNSSNTYFTSSDCSGTPYYSGSNGNWFPYPTVVQANGKFQVVSNQSSTILTLNSSLVPDNSCLPSAQTTRATTGFEVNEVTLPFTMPVTLPLRFE